MKTMRTLKSTIALILALAMICAYLPAGVLAIEPTDWWTEDWTVNSASLWNKVTEGDEVVMQSFHSGDPVTMTYNKSIEYMNTVTFDLRVDEFKADVGNAGIALRSDAGTDFFAYYNSGEHKVVLMDQSKVLDTPLVAGQWYTWNLHWDDTTITLSIGGQQIVSYNYSATGHTFTKFAKLLFSFWWHTSSVKNVTVYRDWDMSQWTVNQTDKATSSKEGAANVLNLSHSEAPVTMTYTGSTAGVNTLDFDMRINEDNPGGGNAGVALRPQAGGEDFYNLLTSANMFRLNDTYVGSPKTEIAMGEYNHWRYQWDGTYLYIFINGKLQLQYNYSATGHDYDGATILFSFWRHNVDLKNIYLSNSAVSNDWDYTLWESVGWTSATEDGVTVYSTSQGPHFLNYNGYLDGKNVFEADIRQNGGAADVGHVSMGIKTWDGQVRYFSYNPASAAMRIFNEYDQLLSSVTLAAPLTEGSYQHWKLAWNGSDIVLTIDGTPIITYDYAAAGLDLAYGATCYVSEYFNPSSAKDIVVGTEWDTTKWTPSGNWGTSVEDGCTVLSSLDLDGVLTLNYTGNLDGMNSFSADVRVNEIYDGFGNVGFAFQGTNGKRMFICYRAGAKSILIFSETDAQLASAVLPEDMVKGEFVNWQFKWDGSVIKLFLDGVEVISFDYASAGMDLTSGATLWLSRWRHGASVKNLEVSYAKPAPASNWTDSWVPGDGTMWYSMLHDGSYVVKSATAANDPAVGMVYSGTINGMQSVEMDIRIDRVKNSGGNVGVGIRTASGAEYFLNYYCFDGVNAYYRNGSTVIAEQAAVLPVNTWMHWTLSWDDTNIYLLVDGVQVASCAHNGDLAEGATVLQSNWMYATSVKDVVFTAQPEPSWSDNWVPQDDFWTLSDGIWTSGHTGDCNILEYTGSQAGMNTLDFDLRFDEFNADVGYAGLCFNAGDKEILIRYNDGSKSIIAGDQSLKTFEGGLQTGKFYHWTVSWDDTTITVVIDGEEIGTYDYSASGIDLSTCTVRVQKWWHNFSIKDAVFTNVVPEPEKDWTDLWVGDGWTESEENGEPIKSAGEGPWVIKYVGGMQGMNSFEADIRIDALGVDFGNVGMALQGYDANGNLYDYFFNYRAMDKAIRLGDPVIANLDEALELGRYYHWQLLWGNGTISLLIDGVKVASTTYDPNVVSFETENAATAISEWYHTSTVKNVKLSYVDIPVEIPDYEEWDPSLWNWDEVPGWWTLSQNLGGTNLLTTDGEHIQLYYKGSVDGANYVGGDVVINRKWWDGAGNNGFAVTSQQGKEYFLYIDANAQTANVYYNGALIASQPLTAPVKLGEEYRMEVLWDDSYISLWVGGVQQLVYFYAQKGDTFGEGGRIGFSEWGNSVTLKDLQVGHSDREVEVEEGWKANGWTDADENGETVWTAQGTESDAYWPSLDYFGSLADINSVAYQLRYNSTNWVEGWVGLILRDGTNNAEWLIDYRADANAVRVRRNGAYLATAQLNFVPSGDEWMDWQVMWSDTTLYVKINDNVILQCNYSGFGDTFDARSSASLRAWGMPSSVKNMEIDKVNPSAWNYVDLEFKDQYAVDAFTVTGGTAALEDGKMVVSITAGGASMQSPRINATAGSMYSAFLPVRNTLLVRMKNDTAADHITVYFVSTLHGEYSQLQSKTFEIEPYSDWTSYYFNLSDVIHMGSAANPYKYTSQVMDSEGYLRGFKFVLPEDVTEGSVAIDAITFEREDPIYHYAGEIVSCVGDEDKTTITVTGKVDADLAGKEVIIYESAVNNYNEAMSYPVNTEHTTEMVAIEELVRATVRSDGTFTAEIPFYAEDGVSRLSSLFLAWIDGVKVSGHFSLENWQDYYEIDRFEISDKVIADVTDPQFGAKGDSFTDDTKAIQAAIDYVAAQGGGVVVLPGDTSNQYGRRYVATNINLKSNIELRIEEGAMIWQSQRIEEYDYSSNYFLEKPIYGHDNDREGVVWAHSINDNLPLVYVGGGYDRATGEWGEAITNVRITGGGTIRMMDTGGEQPDPHNYAWNSNICVGCSNRIHVAPVVFWHADSCDLVGITIQRTNSWHVTTSSCKNMYYANNTLEQAACINSDSFGTSDSKNMTIYRNFVYGNDDGVTVSVAHEDKRAHVFYHIDYDRDNSVENINIVSNQIWNGLGIAFIPWGSGGSDLSRYTTKNILIYDNVLGGESCAIGSWPDNPMYGWSSYYTYNLDKGELDDYSPIQDVRIINNRLRKPYNMRVALITNLIIENTTYKGEQIGYYNSQAANKFLHGNFDRVIRSVVEANGFKDETNWTVGLANWSSILGENGSVGTEKVRADLKYSGYIKGDGQLFQGLYVISGTHELSIKVKAVSGESKVFVADREGNVIAEQIVPANSDFEEVTLKFVAPESNIYRLGVMHSGKADEIVYLDDAVLVNGKYEAQIPVNAQTVTYPFKDVSELNDFRLLNSSGKGGFAVEDGKLVAKVGEGEYKALVKATNRKYHQISMEIYPGESGKINAGVYLGASGANNQLDNITAAGILVESNFAGWADAGNRIDVIFGAFPQWKELYRFTSESGNGNGLFAGGEKEPLKLDLIIEGNIVIVTLSLLDEPAIYTQTIYEYTGDLDLQSGTIGLRALDSDCVYDNLTLVYTETASELDQNEDKLIDKVTFDSSNSADLFDFYTSSNGGFVVKDGKLVPSGETGEFKAIYKDDGAKFSSISVDIYPGADGINSGIYIGAGKADHGVDKIKALAIFVESNFPHAGEEAWDDAVNRIDLVVGQFPIWKELHRYTSETGKGNALFAGSKEPVNLRVDIDGKLVTITLSLLSDPSVFVTTTYEYTGTDDLSLGNVGLRSAFSGASFDNFTVYGEGGKADDGETGDGETGNNSGSTTPDTGDHAPLAAVALAALVSLAALLSMAWLSIKKKYFA